MEGGALVKETYKIESPSLAAKQNSVTTKAATAIADMVEILNGIKKEDLNKILLEVDDNTTFTANFTAMGLIRTQDAKWYLSLKSYTALLQTSEMTNTQSDCYKANADCTITNWCGKTNVELKNAAMQWIAGHSRLVKAIPDTKGISVAEIEKVYNANPNLKEIHNLAKFNTNLKVNNDVLLTQINSFAKPTIGIFASEPEKLKDLTLKFNLESAEVGQYEAELDFNYGILSNKEADITLGSKKEVTSAPKAKENPLLKSGYLYSLADDKTILVGATAGKLFELQNNAGIFYKRIPVKLSVELYGGEAGIKYGLSNNALVRPANLMKWFATDGTLKGNDTKSGDNYNMSVIASSVPQLMNGLYYYPKGGTLKIIKGEKGGTISAKTTAVITAQTQVTIPQRSQPDTALQISEIDQKIDNELTMDAVVAQVIAQNACVVGDVISWNEKKMLSN
jgi:hypothetical protein